MHIKTNRVRELFTFVSFFFIFALILSRLIYIQIISNKPLSELADKQHKNFVKLAPKRGTLYDRQKRLFSIHLESSSIYAVPKEIRNKEKTAHVLAREVGLKEGIVLAKLKKDNYFAWIKRKVTPEIESRVKHLPLEGVYMASEGKRFYPGGKLSCHLLGITDIDNKGLEGLELFYDKKLSGEFGWRRSYRDAKRREVGLHESETLPARNGSNLVLALDEVVQHIIEREIESILAAYQPRAVSIVAIDPWTGEVLGLANYPWFDANDPRLTGHDSMRNRAITDCFEPGSVFKVVTASAALEEKIASPDTEFFCENGVYSVRGRVLHDYKPFGKLTFREIIEKSSNIGTYKLADKLGKDKLYEYVRRFNFGDVTGVDLPGESAGIVRKVSSWSQSDLTTIPMGHGIAVTTLQLATCFSVIANGGFLMRPYVVKNELNDKGMSMLEASPKIVRRVISAETAALVKQMLEGVVLRGTGKRSQIKDYRVCGKTGTAEKVNPAGGYYTDKHIASFVGFAPYDKPRIVLAVTIDEPKGDHLGGHVSAPAFKNIVENILSYMEIEGDKNEAEKTS